MQYSDILPGDAKFKSSNLPEETATRSKLPVDNGSMVVTVLLPNFKTPELTKLCLRSLRKYTNFTPSPDKPSIRVLAIDNASGDESSEYLRSLNWIDLIERTESDIRDLSPCLMHTTALDLALAKVETPYVLSLHTDTIVGDPGWLDFLLAHINRSERVAGVGSWKLEVMPGWKVVGKKLEDAVKSLIGKKPRKFRFLRSHCALYRTELLKKFTKGFGDGETAGSSIHRRLLVAGYEMEFLPEAELAKYMIHLDHATAILNPQLGGRRTGKPSTLRKLSKKMDLESFHRILTDDSLDR